MAERARAAGPIWAIFDADAAKREKWICAPPFVDPDGWFFSGNTLAELAGKIVSKYQKQPMPAAALEATVARYNSFVDAGKDADFENQRPNIRSRRRRSMRRGPRPAFTTASRVCGSTRKAQVIDLEGRVIPGLYCGGESAGGFNQHGLAKCITLAASPAGRLPGHLPSHKF